MPVLQFARRCLSRAGDTMWVDCPNRSQKKTLGFDNTFALYIGSDIVPGMTTGRVFGYPAKRPSSLGCSAWSIIVQRFVHLQNLIGAHGL